MDIRLHAEKPIEDGYRFVNLMIHVSPNRVWFLGVLNNPLHDITMVHLFHAVLYLFPMALTMRIWLTIKSCLTEVAIISFILVTKAFKSAMSLNP